MQWGIQMGSEAGTDQLLMPSKVFNGSSTLFLFSRILLNHTGYYLIEEHLFFH